ncbi:hypothetical protein ACOMHN_001475 [Nucella lapillus]
MRYSRDQLLEIQPSTPNVELVNHLRELRLGVGLPRKRGCRRGRKKLRSIQVVPSRNLHPLMVPPFLQPHPDLQSAVGNAPLSSKHPTQLLTTDCLLSIIPLMGGQPNEAPALSPPSPLQQGGQSSNAPALSPPSPLPQGGQIIALALLPSSPPPQDGQPSDAPGLSPSSSTLLLCPSDSTLSICHLNSQSAVKTGPDQAGEADRDKNDKISDTEFLQSLYFFTDEKRGNQSCSILSCSILSYPVISYPILSYPVLSYLILFYPILSCSILSCSILSCSILSCSILSCPVQSYLVPLYPDLPYPILIYPILIYPILIYPILIYSILIYPILIYPILIYPILIYPILIYPILIYPILFYPILFYPILLYPILFYPVLSCPVQSYLVPLYPDLPYPILIYPILIYPILIYPILIYSILIYPILIYPILIYPILIYPILIYPILIYPILFYPILIYPILIYPILIYSILIYPILFYPILIYPILIYPILIYSILIYPILFYPILIYPILIYPILFYPILIYPILIYPILIYPIVIYPILIYPNLIYPILFYPILIYPILFYPILIYPILFYPILFYPILIYPILSYHVISYPTLFYHILSDNRRVTQAEFVDGYRRQFGLPSELLVIMFDLLDDLNDDASTRQDSDVTDRRNNKYFDVFSKMSAGRGIFGKNHQNKGDGILTQRDVTVRKFVGESKQSNKEEYRKSLMKWVAAAADRLYSINYQPHIPGNPWDLEFDYERWFSNVDRNNDSLVSFKELSDEFRRYSPDGRVKRSRWVDRNVQTYGDREWLATVVYDYWDKNKDLRLDDLDIGLLLKEADRNRDTRVTTIEFHRFMEKYNKRARRRLATPVRPVMYDCPGPWWQSFGCRPRVDATRAAMDMDDNYDGWITQGELRKRVAYYDRNGDGWASRLEVTMLESMRYGVPGPVADVMFDVYDRNGDGRYDISDVQHMLSNGRVLCFCDARRAVMELVKLATQFRKSPQARLSSDFSKPSFQGRGSSARSAMRWQLKREWQKRRLVERLWHSVWGEGGPGSTCREGDCTGKDWRGGAWYSPYDWRQKNRVPENFLQWSYLHDIPRTISSLRGFGAGTGRSFPSGGPSWWNPRWFQGDGGYGDANAGSRNTPGGGAPEMSFPSAGAPGSGQRPPGSAMPMPSSFMPNPSRTPSRPGGGGFPAATSHQGPGMDFPPMAGDSDNSAEDFWNRLLSGLDNETAPGMDPEWMKANMNILQKVFSKDRSFPQWSQTGATNRNKPWNREVDSPSFSDTFRNRESGLRSSSNPQASVGQGPRDDSLTARGGSGRSGNRGGGKRRPPLGSSRFRREAAESSDSEIPVSPVPLPPSPTSNPTSADSVNSSSGDTDSVKSTRPDRDDQATGQSWTETNNTDHSTEQNTTKPVVDEESTSLDTDRVQGKSSPKDEAEKIGRSSAWLRVPFDTSQGLNYDRYDGGPNCDVTEPWVGDDMSDYNIDPRNWEQTWRGEQDWSPMNEGWPSADPTSAIIGGSFQDSPFSDSHVPQWWNMWNTNPSQPLQSTWNTNQMWKNSDSRPTFDPRNPNPYSPPDQELSFPRGSQHNLYKRSTGSQNGKTNQEGDEKVSRWLGNYKRHTPSQWNNNYYNNNRPIHSYPFSWWDTRNGYFSWLQNNERNSNNMWRNNGGQTSFYPRDWNVYSPSWSQNSGFPMGSQHTLHKRSTDQDKENDVQSEDPQASRMMDNRYYGGYDPSQPHRFNNYGGHWPQWWNMWNNYRQWPGSKRRWNNNNPWNNYNQYKNTRYWPGYHSQQWTNNNQPYPYSFSADGSIRMKRSTDDADTSGQAVSRMMGDRWPQWWNMWNTYRSWPAHWKNWNWMWNSYSPFYFSTENRQQLDKEHILSKRSSEDTADQVSRMMESYGGHWPQWWNMWNNYGHWPGHWNSWNNNWMWNRWNSHNPFYFAKEGSAEEPEKEHVMSKRSTDNSGEAQVSNMMAGYGGYWPQRWNMWNNYRSWPGHWNNWNNNWMWNSHYPFYFSKGNKESFDKEHVMSKRSTDQSAEDQVSRMMGGYGGYRPQWWNTYRQWHGHWNNNWRWNNNNNQWNNYNQWNNNWQPMNNNQFYPYSFSADGSVRMKRSADNADTSGQEVSRMMGDRWPQWWNTWNTYMYWPGHWNNWNWMSNRWNSHNPLYFAKEGSAEEPEKEHIISKRSTDNSGEDQVANMMGGYGGYWPQRWNNQYPFYLSKEDKELSGKEHVMSKRSTDNSGEDQVANMMGGYGGYWPQRWNMWNNNGHWPGSWMWNNNRYVHHNNPFYFSRDQGYVRQNMRTKRSTIDNTENGDISRMIGAYGGYWPQWWNTYRSWPGHWNNNWRWNNNNNQWNNYNQWNTWQWMNKNPYSFSADSSANKPVRMKRSTENADTSGDEVSRMMGGYGGYWPQRWNMWNTYRQWPGHWNNWNWRWNSYSPFYFSKENREESDREHVLSKRSTDLPEGDQVSRMMAGYGCYPPQWWNMWNNYRSWPGHWNNWNNNWMWNNYRSFQHYYPFWFSQQESQTNGPIRIKREAVDENTHDDKGNDDVPRMMGGYGGYWPQRWNMWNTYRQWPGHWNNWNWRWNSYSPFYFSKENKEESDREHVMSKRSTDNPGEDKVANMMGGYGGYWPQWWNMWNNYRSWPGHWNSWNNNWMWNSHRSLYHYYPFWFSQQESQTNGPIRMKREAVDENTHDDKGNDDVSRMMGGYGGYWPQSWNMWNTYRQWPGHWNNNWRWNTNNNQWNNYNQWNTWQWMNKNPYSFSADNSANKPVKMKGSTENADTDGDEVSRMMGGYGGYWPQWWNTWNTYRQWPGHWNNRNWRWNSYSPFYFSKENREESDREHILSKRSTDLPEGDQVSRMMAGYGGYRPQWWNMWNNYRSWPGHWNSWNNNWMWNSHRSLYHYYPFWFSQQESQTSRPIRMKREAMDENTHDVSRMMGGYGGYRPQWWNMWNTYSYWPGHWNNWNWRWNSYNPFYFAKEGSKEQLVKEHVMSKRSTDQSAEDQVSRMMGGYGGYWPQWWNMWNTYRQWPGHWNTWNWRGNNNWMWNNQYPFYLSKEDKELSDKEHVMSKRSTDNSGEDQVANMMGGYGGYWPQRWNMWNNNGHWPGSWMWNNNRYFHHNNPFYFSRDQGGPNMRMKRSNTDSTEDGDISRMMGGYGGYWPQWWNMWNTYRQWPGHWNNNRRWNNNNYQWNNYNKWNKHWQWMNENQLYPHSFSAGSSGRMKRSTDGVDTRQKDRIANMMGGYGGYWSQRWNMWNTYRSWPGHWNNWSNNWMWNSHYPFYFSKGNKESLDKEHVMSKRSTDQSAEDQVPRMMGGYGDYRPQWWNTYRQWPGHWNNNWRWNNNNNQWNNYNQYKNNRYWPGYNGQQWTNNNQPYPHSFSADSSVRMKRSTEDADTSKKEVSRMNGGYGGYWPQWGNMWNTFRSWPGHWNNWNWRWNSHNPFYFSTENREESDRAHVLSKRSTDLPEDDQVSRMMGGYGGYRPQWWNMGNTYRSWPGHWTNNWEWNNRNNQWNNNNNQWNSYNQYKNNRYWPGYNGQQWMDNNQLYPYSFSANSSVNTLVRLKRSTDDADTSKEDVSRMMGGYGGYWPQWGNTWNTYRQWSGHWNNWNWMWNKWNSYNTFYFSKENKELSDKEHILSKRSSDTSGEDQVANMMGGYGGYWPQWWNMWNTYRSWPGHWNNWNNNWMWNSHWQNSHFFAKQDPVQDGSGAREHIITKRDASSPRHDQMMTDRWGVGCDWNPGHELCQESMWNEPRQWPQWMWNVFNQVFPFYSTEGQLSDDKEDITSKQTSDKNKDDMSELKRDDHVTKKRSVSTPDDKHVSRMMGGYGGYWPQGWNMWNTYRQWPGHWNNWNWMWNSRYPFYFSEENKEHSDKEHILTKRSSEDQVSRMMGSYGGYWPQGWNNYRNWPGHWNTLNWMWNRRNTYSPFYFAKEDIEEHSGKEHVMSKRSTDNPGEDQVANMMGGYGGYWPQRWNTWNTYRQWPGHWNNNWRWNNNNNQWNSYNQWNTWQWMNKNPYSFSADSSANKPVRMKRSIENADTGGDEVSRMMGGYGGYWPQWWNTWNTYKSWPGHWNSHRNWNNNRGWKHSINGFPFSSYHYFQSSQYSDGHHVFKRDTSGHKEKEALARMMNGYPSPSWHESGNVWNKGNSPYWNNQQPWSNDWNRNHWTWNIRQFPPGSFFYQQNGNPEFPSNSGYQQQTWDSGNHAKGFSTFHPFAFSQGGRDAFDDLAKSPRAKRSSESALSGNKAAENRTDSSSSNDTESASEPDVARQMTGYDGSPGNPRQQQWDRPDRSYLNSKPRFFRRGPYFTAYDDPYDSFYRLRYSNRHGRYYYIRYILPRRVYQYWLWQMRNRQRAQNDNMDRNDHDALWRDYTSRYAPFSTDPDIRHQQNNDAVSEKERGSEGEEKTTNTPEKRTKRSMGEIYNPIRYPYKQGNMYDTYSGPRWWKSNMHGYSTWPGWNYRMYNGMWGPRNGNSEWMWSTYNRHPFMHSQSSETSSGNTQQETEAGVPSTDQNTAAATEEGSRSRRSTGHQSKHKDIENEDVSRWLRIPDKFSRPAWQQTSWGRPMPGLMGGDDRAFSNFFPGFMDNNVWKDRFVLVNELNQDRNWGSFDNFSPFFFAESDTSTDKESSHKRQERSAEETIRQQPSYNGADPKVSQQMRGFSSMPAMTSMVHPWPVGTRPAWRYQGHNSQSQWRAWNRWGEGRAWGHWNTATFPSLPLAFSSSAENRKDQTVRLKRSSESSPDITKDDSEEASENKPEVSRMGGEFGWASVYPREWRRYGPSSFTDYQWTRYNWPMVNFYLQTPWGSDWKRQNQFPFGQFGNQNRFYPRWNQYQNTPFWGWNSKGSAQWEKLQNFQKKMNYFSNDHVDESVYDPLSSYYFSKKDAVNTNSDQKPVENMSDKTTGDSKTAVSQEEKVRSRRSAVTLDKLISKGQDQPEAREITFQTMMKPNRRFVKRNVQYKLKRFSPEARSRLEKRFQKRSADSNPDPSPKSDESSTNPEVAPELAMRATAPARDQSTRDREWGPPSGAGFAANPTRDPRLSDRSEIPNSRFSPNGDAGQGSGGDPLGNYGSLGDSDWSQPGWNSNPDWAGGRERGSQDGGRNTRPRNQNPQGPQDRGSPTTTTTTGSQPTSDNPSEGGGDSQDRLSDYNYIDFNNPDYWKQFYNPDSFNSSDEGSVGNATHWDNWFGLWAYGPNFWDDMNDLDLWDAPWGSGSWGMGPGGDDWDENRWGNPSTGFSSTALPVEIGLEIYWLGDCDGDLINSGYGPWDTREWLVPAQLVDDVEPRYSLDGDCGDCFRPYALFPRRYRGDSSRPIPYDFRPSFSAFRPTRYSYRPSRFFRPMVRPRGSSGGPWYKRFPGYPWDSYG